jgi:hypothetical protein
VKNKSKYCIKINSEYNKSMPLLRWQAAALALLVPSITFASSGFSEGVIPFAGTATTSLPDAINAIATAFLVLTTTLALIVLVVGGMHYILSQGDEEKTEKAKKTMVGALMGLLVIGLSGAGVNCVLNMINGKGCGGGGGDSVRVAVAPPQSLPPDALFGGNLPLAQEPVGGSGNEIICQPCQLTCMINQATGAGRIEAKPLCNVKWRLVGKSCRCDDIPKDNRAGLTQKACKAIGGEVNQQQEKCGKGKWWLTGGPALNCRSEQLTDDESTSWGNGQCLAALPKAEIETSATSCTCECEGRLTGKMLCKYNREPRDCRLEDQIFTVDFKNAVKPKKSCKELNGEMAIKNAAGRIIPICNGYSSASLNSRELGIARECVATNPSKTQ